MTWQKQAGYGLVGFATGAISTLVLFHLTDLILTLLVVGSILAVYSLSLLVRAGKRA